MIERLLEADRLLALGLTDQAERIYWQAAEMDPRDAIAVVGLARVASEKGDDRTALEFARKAVQIDPENPAAQRLAARLEEILATRDAAATAAAMPQAAPPIVDAEPGPPAADAAPAPPVAYAADPPAAAPTERPGRPPATAQAAGPGPAAQPRPPGAQGPTSGTRSTKQRRGLLGRLLGGR